MYYSILYNNVVRPVICKGVVLNYETKSKCNERNETKYYATKYTKMRKETQRNEIYQNAKRNEIY